MPIFVNFKIFGTIQTSEMINYEQGFFFIGSNLILMCSIVLSIIIIGGEIEMLRIGF
jgi:hypothetical protein